MSLLSVACGKRGAPPVPGPEPSLEERRVYLFNLPSTQVAHMGQAPFDLRPKGQPRRLDRIALGGASKRAFLMDPGVELAFSGLPGGSASLHYAYGWPFGTGASVPPLELEVFRPGAGGERDVLARHTLEPPLGAELQWIEATLELPNDSPGEIGFDVRSPTGVQRGRLALGQPYLRFAAPLPEPRETAPTCVVVVLIDTLRADHLGAYGHTERTSPNIDALASESLLFERASSAASWTKASVASLLTGRYPSSIGVEGYPDRLPHDVETLADVMGANGFRTGAIGFSPWIFQPKYGFSERYDQSIEVVECPKPPDSRSDRVMDQVIDWLDRNHDVPFLLYVHTIDPHAPYDPVPEEAERFADPSYSGPVDAYVAFPELNGGKLLTKDQVTEADLHQSRALYDAEIAYNDLQLGRLVARLRALGLWDECLFVLTADHGEEFLDHGAWSHGGGLYEEQLHVPLLIKPPRSSGMSPRRVPTPVSLVDVFPTVLQFLRIPHEGSDLAGQSLVELVLDPERWARPWVLSELDKANNELVSVRDGDWKYIHRFRPRSSEQLFDLSQDPGEQTDRLADADPELLRRLREIVTTHREQERQAGIHIDFYSGPESLKLNLFLHSHSSSLRVRLPDYESGEDATRLARKERGITLKVPIDLSVPGRRFRVQISDDTGNADVTFEIFAEAGALTDPLLRTGTERVARAVQGPVHLQQGDPSLLVQAQPSAKGLERPTILVYSFGPETVEIDEQERDEMRSLGYFGEEDDGD